MNLKLGDVVWLNSGGPPMTVTCLNEGLLKDKVDVSWIDNNDELHSWVCVASNCLTKTIPKNAAVSP